MLLGRAPRAKSGSLNWFRRGREVPETEAEMPLDVFAEGNLVSSSRDNGTAIELFVAGVRGWEVGLRRQMEGR
jgi:hypothetical protein